MAIGSFFFVLFLVYLYYLSQFAHSLVARAHGVCGFVRIHSISIGGRSGTAACERRVRMCGRARHHRRVALDYGGPYAHVERRHG